MEQVGIVYDATSFCGQVSDALRCVICWSDSCLGLSARRLKWQSNTGLP